MTPVASWGQHQNRFGRRYRVLLDSARQLREGGYFEAAIVTAQTACEVCAEIVISDVCKGRGIGHLAGTVMGLLNNNYNLANLLVRKLYRARSKTQKFLDCVSALSLAMRVRKCIWSYRCRVE